MSPANKDEAKMFGGKRKVVISGMLGNGLEWYDYALYGHMAVTFSKLFFPATDGDTSLILTYLAFAAGFIARPIGAVLFGHIGDKYGRKKALVTSMILMAAATGCIGLLPTYAMVGIAAPVLLLIIRVLQGLSLGGAFSGSMSYVVEHAPEGRRGAIGSVTIISLVLGFLIGSMVSTLVASSMSAESFHSWGWRLPFFVGIGIGFVGYYIRHHGEESPVYEQAKKAGALSSQPVKDAFTHHPMKMVQAFIAYLFVTVPFYMIAIYMIGYSSKHLGLTEESSLQINSLAMLSMALLLWPAAILSDRIGRRKVLLGAIIGVLLITVPAFRWMQEGAALAAMGDMHAAFIKVAMGQCLLAFMLGAYLSPIPALLVELFPTHVRYTGMAMSYNLCAILGGFTPAIGAYMITQTGDKSSIMWLLVGCGIIAFITLFFYRDRWREPLQD